MIRVSFNPKRAPSGTMELTASALWSVRDLLPSRGFELIDRADGGTADIDWIFKDYITPEMLASGRPIIVDEARDAAEVSPTVRRWINEYNILGVVKKAIYRDPVDNFLNAPDVGLHHNSYYACHPDLYPGPPKSRGEDFDTGKLIAGFGYGALERLKPLHSAPLQWQRPIDAHFGGWVEYKQKPVRHYRFAAVEAVADLECRTAVWSGRKIPLGEYWQCLRQSKICVSPWGLGATCHRDAEAVLCGSVLLKPPSRHVYSWPDLLTGGNYFECRADYSDLPDVVAGILGDYRNIFERCIEARRALIDATAPERMADHAVEIFTKCLAAAN